MEYDSSIRYFQRADATREGEIATLAAVYKLCLESCHVRKEATRSGSSDDAERRSNDGARDILQETE
jgi:hypothetical protein